MALPTWTADGIPSLKNYTQALDHVDTRKPYQKNSNYAGQLPWGGNRRYTRSLIRKATVGGIENVVVCSYYGTDVISYFPDGTIKINQAHSPTTHNGKVVHYIWDSVSTGLVIKAGLGRFQPNENHCFIARIERTRSMNYYIDNNKQYHLIREGITILPSGEVEGGTVEHLYKLNKPKMAALRKKYKPFVDYGDLILKFNNDVSVTNQDEQTGLAKYGRLTTETYVLKHRGHEMYDDARATWFDVLDEALAITDEDKRSQMFYPLFQAVATHAAEREWMKDNNVGFNGMRWRMICQPEKFREYVYELIRFEFAYMLFDKEVASKERPAPAANQKYVGYGRTMPRVVKTNLQDVSVSQDEATTI